MLRWLAQFPKRKRACEAAVELVQNGRAGERIHGSVVVDEDARRYVVRVFIGERENREAAMLPPWRECVIVAVYVNGDPAKIIDEPRYRPTLR